MRTLWIVLFSIVGTIIFIAAALFLVVILIRRKHRQEVDANFKKITGGLSAVVDGFRTVRNGVHFIWCYVLIYFWKARFYVRTSLPVVMIIIFVIAGFFTFIEASLNVADWFSRTGWAPHFTSHAARVLAEFMASTREFLHALYSKLYLLIFLLICEALIIVNHLHEFKHQGREQRMLAQVLDLIAPLNELCVYLQLADNEVEEETEKRTKKRHAVNVFLKYFSKTFTEIFRERGLKDLNVCLMGRKEGTEDLFVEFESSGHEDFEVREGNFLKGEGAAGRALTTNKTIYVPNVEYEHAVVVTERVNDVESKVYVKRETPYRSIICSPIVLPTGLDETSEVESASDVVAILNFASRRKSAFSEVDFVVARLGATLLGLMYYNEKTS